MADKYTSDDIRAATTTAEDCQSVSRILNEMPMSERVNFTRAMQAQNREDRASIPNLPVVRFDYGKDSNGSETVVGGSCVRKPEAAIPIMRNSTQIYDGRSAGAADAPTQAPQNGNGAGGAEKPRTDIFSSTLRRRESEAGT